MFSLTCSLISNLISCRKYILKREEGTSGLSILNLDSVWFKKPKITRSQIALNCYMLGELEVEKGIFSLA